MMQSPRNFCSRPWTELHFEDNGNITPCCVMPSNIHFVANGIDNYFKSETLAEIKQYCLERNNGIDAEQFFDFYESKNWYVGKNKMKNWQAAIRTWEKRKTKTSKIDAQLDNYNNAKKHLGL